jgi:5-formyltetrahydrofolate cyclo-ligase
MTAKLRETKTVQREAWSARICDHLEYFLMNLEGAGAVAFFGGLATEPNLMPLLHRLCQQRVKIALFRVTGYEMEAHLLESSEDMVRSRLGVWEPKQESLKTLAPAELKAILVPALAFSKQTGARLGRGAGCYDRYLEALAGSPSLIGVGFDLQMIDEVPSESHDVAMQFLVSENGCTVCNPD